mmetsp:Transcript_3346/g.9513  ORF Transcript_3346/g.9513 Transcript_3346/m.9513 type:complete len:457 (+) Transcript_3346:1-1371(+)
MKPEVRKPQVPGDLVDLVRVFLLHRLLPLSRLCQIFGPECCQLLLSLQALTAVEGSECRLVPPAKAVAAVQADRHNCGALLAFANVAVWPLEEDLLVATDFEQTFSSDDLEPVMYLSEDSLALVSAAPRGKVATVLDACCGSGVQGLVALQQYADSATFIDANPRAIRFVEFNLALNGMAHKAAGLHVGDLYDALPATAEPFDAIVANPPFVPNPHGIASGGNAMFGNGGDTGERVLAALIRGSPRVLRPGGRLAVVAMSPNVEELPGRVREWYNSGAGDGSAFEALIFRGPPTPASQYLPTSSAVETNRYQAALQHMGVATLSEIVLVLTSGGGDDPEVPSPAGQSATIAGDPREELWSDHLFLRLVVQRAVATAEPLEPPAFWSPQEAPALRHAGGGLARDDGPPPQMAAEKESGNLPGFQAGFFPASCTAPARGWEATARELAKLAEGAVRGV